MEKFLEQYIEALIDEVKRWAVEQDIYHEIQSIEIKPEYPRRLLVHFDNGQTWKMEWQLREV
jgi:hypothetical protein